MNSLQELWYYEKPMLIVGLLIIIMLVVVVIACNSDIAHKQRLMAQCMEDKIPEYECYAKIIKSDTSVVPVIIPIR